MPYETAVRYAHEFGLNDLSNYMLYNFHDSPADLFERMYLNVRLNEELSIRIYSFPMRYQPTDLPVRTHVGPKWNRYYLRSVQLVLQATHGVVSGEPEFFKAAFGATQEEFEDILSLPHHMIFNRHYYERYEGRGELDDIAQRFTDFRSQSGRSYFPFCRREIPQNMPARWVICRQIWALWPASTSLLRSSAKSKFHESSAVG